MSETNPNPETEPESSSPQTYLADDVTNEPTGSVEQTGPTTYRADHVPEDAPTVLETVADDAQATRETKVVQAPAAETATPSGVDVQTA